MNAPAGGGSDPGRPSYASPMPGVSFEVICGPMFAGKTTELMRRIATARDAGQRVLVVKPAHDTRYAETALSLIHI